MTAPQNPRVTQADEWAARAEEFGEQYRETQKKNSGCSGDIVCSYPMNGNCYCFSKTLARHREAAEAASKAREAAIIERCAQVAERLAESASRWLPDPKARIKVSVAGAIATSIRALTKEPDA